MTIGEMVFGSLLVGAVCIPAGTIVLFAKERIGKIREKRKKKEELNFLRKKFLEDKRICSLIYFGYDDPEYEEILFERSVSDLKEYLHCFVSILQENLSKKELKNIEDRALEILSFKDSLGFGSVVFMYYENINRIYGEIVLRKIGVA